MTGAAWRVLLHGNHSTTQGTAVQLNARRDTTSITRLYPGVGELIIDKKLETPRIKFDSWQQYTLGREARQFNGHLVETDRLGGKRGHLRRHRLREGTPYFLIHDSST